MATSTVTGTASPNAGGVYSRRGPHTRTGMRTPRRHRRVVWALPVLATAALLAGCGPDSDDNPTNGPTVTVTIPTTPTTSPTPTPTDSATTPAHAEEDNHDHGDLTDAPDLEQIDAAQQVARDFWLALTERTWDHPDGPDQWLTAVEPFTTEQFHTELVDTYAGHGGGVAWDEFYFAHGTITAQVRQALFDPSYDYDKKHLTVVDEGASALRDDTYNLDPDDSPSTYHPVTLTLTSDGWKVSGYGT